MTPVGRGLLGAAVGAVLTLAVHPASRPYLLEVLSRSSRQSMDSLAGFSSQKPPEPNNLKAAGVWMQLASFQLQHGIKLSAPALKTLLSLCKQAEQLQPDNAYWRQMDAVFLGYQGDYKGARAEWIRGSVCDHWNDFQTERLLEVRQKLIASGVFNQSWILAYLFFSRSEAAVAEIQRFAADLVRNTNIDDDNGLAIRFASIRNGYLIREGSQNIRVGNHGAQMVELATYPSPLSGVRNPKRIWIAETSLTARLRQLGQTDKAHQADQAFARNDAWRALTERQNPDETLRSLCMGALLSSSLPGALALAALCGLVSFGAGLITFPRSGAKSKFPLPVLIVLATAIALEVFVGTGSVWTALPVAGSILFLYATPRFPRALKDIDIGPLFVFLILCQMFVIVSAFASWLITTCTASSVLLPDLGPTGEYLGDSKMFLCVGCIATSTICLLAGGFALAQRHPTPQILSLTVRRLGSFTAVFGLLLCILAVPFSIVEDRTCGKELSKLLENEPLYYLIKRT